MFPDEYHGALVDDLATIEKDTVLWDVFAWDNPEELGGREELIGMKFFLFRVSSFNMQVV